MNLHLDIKLFAEILAEVEAAAVRGLSSCCSLGMPCAEQEEDLFLRVSKEFGLLQKQAEERRALHTDEEERGSGSSGDSTDEEKPGIRNPRPCTSASARATHVPSCGGASSSAIGDKSGEEGGEPPKHWVICKT